ncbi:IS256 family transposase [Streptosporangium sp. NBC_01755]|uniref:IS256 family transposase n=1 Tax=Streptosporangium sp. NBC_01755 TaxID=2975949 RepID=UPI003FA3B8FE
MSVIEGVDGTTSTTVSNLSSAVSEVTRRPIRELIDDRQLDELLARSRDEAGGLRLTGENSMLGDLVKAVLERALEAELTAHLGYTRHASEGYNSGNSRNGAIRKTVQTAVGPVKLSVPRDRAGSFEPVLVPKRAGRVAGGLDDMVISLYAHGMSVRDIVHHLEQVYDTHLSAETVSRITEQVMEEVKAWQRRPLDAVYAVVFLDAIMVKVRDNHVVRNKPAYLAVGVDTDGDKHVLGIWTAKTEPGARVAGEGAGFWRGVVTDLRNRGVTDILIACCDGLSGFEDAICATFPHTTVQTCIVHLIRNSLRLVPRKERAEVAAEMKRIYTAPDADAALEALAAFAATALGARYPQAVRVWESAWEQVTPFLAFTPAVRRLLYTTNSIESLNYQLRKVIKARGHFPGDDAVVKLLWPAIVNIEDKRARERAAHRGRDRHRPGYPGRLIEGQRTHGWCEALNELAIAYPGRIG